VDGKIEYTKLGFGISHSPTKLVKTERKWHLELRDRWWEPSQVYDSWEDSNQGTYPLLVFAHGKIPKSAAGKDYCGYALADLNTFFRQFKMYVGNQYVIGGRGWQIKTVEDRGKYDLPRNDKLWHLSRCKLTLDNGQQYDFTFCYIERDNWLYAFKLFTPEPRRNDDFELMLAWMDSLYFLTNSPPPTVKQ